MNFKYINSCRVCSSLDLIDLFSLPEQFLSPTFVDSNENNNLTNIKIPMTLTLCDNCGLVQLRETTNPELLYTNYFYRSSTNETMRRDLTHVVNEAIRASNPQDNDIVVDIGANDGMMIGFFPSNLQRIGIEPAKNISWGTLESIKIINDFFSYKSLSKIIDTKKVKIFTSCAMFYDLDDPNSFVHDIKKMMATDGIFVIQLSYLVSMLENMNFYDICHEHLSYYSLITLDYLMQQNNLSIFDAEVNDVNGGSILVFVSHKNSKLNIKTNRYLNLLHKEKSMQLSNKNTFIDFYNKIMNLSETVQTTLFNEKSNGQNVIGLGASTKGNVLLQLFKIDKNLLPYIAEINPEKIGKYTLGTDIKLISDEDANALNPSMKLVLPWYFKNEIIKREKTYLENGGKLLFPMPYVHVVSRNGERAL